MPTVYDSGWHQSKGFRVRTTFEAGLPSELRSAWYTSILAKELERGSEESESELAEAAEHVPASDEAA